MELVKFSFSSFKTLRVHLMDVIKDKITYIYYFLFEFSIPNSIILLM